MITSVKWGKAEGQRLKAARMRRGLNQGQLCQEARIPGTRILSQFECGSNSPKMDRLEAICKALGVSVKDILEGKSSSGTVSVKKAEIPKEKAVSVDAVPVQDGSVPADSPRLFPGDTVGARLRYIREQNGFSRPFVAEFISVSAAMVARYESDKNLVSEKALLTFAELYSCSAENLATSDELEEIRRHDKDPMVIRNRKNQDSGKRKAADTKKNIKGNAGNEKKAKKPSVKTRMAVQKSVAEDVPAGSDYTETPTDFVPVVEEDAVVEEIIAEETASDDLSVEDVPEENTSAGNTSFLFAVDKDPLFPDGEPKLEEISGNALELMLLIRRKRCEKQIPETRIAEAAGMTVEEYRNYEKGGKDITIAQFSFIAKELMIAPYALIKEGFIKEWLTFWGDDRKDTCAAVGACIMNSFTYSYKDGDGFINVYGDGEKIKRVFRNLHISGKFV